MWSAIYIKMGVDTREYLQLMAKRYPKSYCSVDCYCSTIHMEWEVEGDILPI